MTKQVKVSDLIAQFLKEKDIKHVFGIIGSANSHIFDSISNLGFTEIICVHHEQAATMAMQTYYRTSGKISAAILTAGGGSINGLTGVMGAWADSIPGIVISGQENSRHIKNYKDMRMWGIQGFDVAKMVKDITKYSSLVMNPTDALYELEKSHSIALSRRPGPVWLDFPMDVQGSSIDEHSSKKYIPSEETKIIQSNLKDLTTVLDLLKNSKRPVLWLGHGIRLSNSENLIYQLLDKVSIPVIVSWAGLDMLESSHPLNYGRAGVYGTRSANLIIQNSDLVISIGNRMSILMIGYEHSEFARAAKIVQVEIDQDEINKVKDIVDYSIHSDASHFLNEFVENISEHNYDFNNWIDKCNKTRKSYPLIGPEHADTNNYINSYQFMNKLSKKLRNEDVLVTDMGTGLLSGHQALELKKSNRLMTSTGLGEMGFGLPGAIGASFAKKDREIICLNCDGGMMMNLQELQTIDHHKLPIKIFIFNNDGYLMIKHTQKGLFKGRYTGTNNKSGVSCPDFLKVAKAFNMDYFSIKTWDDFDFKIDKILEAKGPVICDIFMDPEQFFHPKLSIALQEDGTIISPPLEDLSPLLDRDILEKEMIIGLHEKSKKIS
jgi:acetolactate synthase-1/2/3 large subunit